MKVFCLRERAKPKEFETKENGTVFHSQVAQHKAGFRKKRKRDVQICAKPTTRIVSGFKPVLKKVDENFYFVNTSDFRVMKRKFLSNHSAIMGTSSACVGKGKI